MEHFYHLQDGQNWFTSPNLYKKFVETCPPNGTIVEVGCWKGRSSACLVVESINSNKNLKIFCVDTWLGSIDIPSDEPDVKNGTLYEKFMSNMKPVLGHFTSLRLPSVEASKTFEDNSLDIVFIDASHEYNDVKNDILAWLPKVKNGGILSGHDYKDPTFPGLTKAVFEILPAHINAGERCWWYNKI